MKYKRYSVGDGWNGTKCDGTMKLVMVMQNDEMITGSWGHCVPYRLVFVL